MGLLPPPTSPPLTTTMSFGHSPSPPPPQGTRMSPTEKLKQIVVSSIRRYSLRSPPPQSPLQPLPPIWKASSRTATSTGAVISLEPAIECVGSDLVVQDPPRHVGLAPRRALSAPIRRYPRPSSPGIPLWPALRMTMPRQVELYLHVYLSRRSSVIRLRGIPRLSPMQRSGLVSTPVGRFAEKGWLRWSNPADTVRKSNARDPNSVGRKEC